MICFQILTFAVSATASFQKGRGCSVLWFAFKFLPLQYLRQLRACPSHRFSSCDLLSNSYLCSICDSPRPYLQIELHVVICFQILTFAVSATAGRLREGNAQVLWFAFKFLPLQYLRQPGLLCAYTSARCDLLSNSYLCSICDSFGASLKNVLNVVICFQILTFAVSATAPMGFLGLFR